MPLHHAIASDDELAARLLLENGAAGTAHFTFDPVKVKLTAAHQAKPFFIDAA